MRPTALLLTHRGDFFTIDRVAEAIERRGGEAIRLDTDTFPHGLDLEAIVDADGIASAVVVGDRRIDPAAVRGVWCRRLWSAPPPEGMPEDMALACVRESAATLRFWLAGFEGHARFVNRFDRETAAENKLRQLAAARAAGLAVPETLVTNRPAAARAFWHAHRGRVVAKMLTTYAMGMERTESVYTSPVTEADLDGLDGLRQSPMVFQARVDKAYELRAIVVGDRVFAGAIDATHSEAGQTDWRRASPGELTWQPAAVPPELAARLCAVVRRLGLVYGAADVIIRKDRTPVFLEVNPAGEWGMIERDLDLPISDAIAAELLAPPEALP